MSSDLDPLPLFSALKLSDREDEDSDNAEAFEEAEHGTPSGIHVRVLYSF